MDSQAHKHLLDAQSFFRDLDLKSEWSEEVERRVLEHLRFLRGICVNSRINQNKILNSNIPQLVISSLTLCLKEWDVKYHKCIVCGTQFLGNLVADNSDTQSFVWNLIFPEMLRHLLSLKDPRVSEITSMIIYNCLLSPEVNCGCLFEDGTDASRVFFLLYESITIAQDSDWIIFCINEHFASAKSFLPFVFEHGSNHCKGAVLDILLSHQEIPMHVLEFLINQFVSQSGNVEDMEQYEDMNAALVPVKVLEVLCEATSQDIRTRAFLSEGNFLDTTIAVLGKVTAVGKMDPDGIFGLVRNRPPSVGARGTKEYAFVGFKSLLVRVIANLCCRNERNQNKVRELGGIELILQHFNLDDHNPFLQQWSIFAVRNLCENNLANQEVVASYERLTASESPILRRPGGAVELLSGRTGDPMSGS